METRVLGLDYTAVIATAKVYKFKLTPHKMDLIRIAEQEIIKGA